METQSITEVTPDIDVATDHILTMIDMGGNYVGELAVV